GSGVGVTVGAGVGINPQADNRMESVQNRLSNMVYFFMIDDFLPWFGIGYRCNYTGGIRICELPLTILSGKGKRRYLLFVCVRESANTKSRHFVAVGDVLL
ncbi:MAG TPA: hypothetical protein DF984_05225, partial [Anaerolineaceae bacterium]|nr:hypothetical protein [Anaerolineaceae bacterium]